VEDSHQPRHGALKAKMPEQRAEPPGARLIDLREQLQFDDQHPQACVLFESQDARLVGFALRAGQEIKAHRSPSPLLAQVIEGRLIFIVADQPFSLCAGMVLRIEAGVPHSLRATADTLMLLVMTPDPARVHAEGQDRS
jgi:quercetin dioxygenase-like cupin family protein